MKSYNLILKQSVEKDFRGLSKNVLVKIFSVIDNLQAEPFPSKTTKLEGTDKTYRIRVGEYRIIYEVNKTEKIVTILYVRHRREVYRKF